MLTNDSNGYALDGNTVRLTLIYDPDNLPEIRTHEIHAGLRPCSGDLSVPEAIRLGRGFNHALRVVGTDVHAGRLPAAATGIGTTPDSVILSSVKKAEDGDASVLTFFNPTGQDAVVSASFDEGFLGRPTHAVEVDLMERPVAGSSARCSRGGDRAGTLLHGIASVKVSLSPATSWSATRRRVCR